jgi:molybdenum cofactor cytidylyltransferase
MRFGPVPLAEARGAVLAHTQRLPGQVLKKGTVLDDAALEALRAAQVESVVAARLDATDVAEDEAADRLANALTAPLLARGRAATGRVNLMAESAGLLRVDAARVDALNGIDEGITLATLADHSVVAPRDMVATVKIIPFAVPGHVLGVAEAMARQAPLLRLLPFRPLKVGLVLTELPGIKNSVTEGTIEATEARVSALGGTLLPPMRTPHAEAAVAEALRRLLAQGAEMLLVAGASAVVDRADVGPAAIVRTGGAIRHLGMPVDPGNLLCLGEVKGTPAMVLPGCARSPKLNGIDWVMQRLFAGVPVSGSDIMRMGVGGLLKEVEHRPLPREEAARSTRAGAPRRPPAVAAVVLAAGRSRRMAPLNKLLVTDRAGTPMIRRVVDAALASRAAPVLVVLGHQADQVEAALTGRPVRFVHAPDYAEGLSASLRAGIGAVPPEAAGAIVLLGDMPLVGPHIIDRLLAAFDPEEGRSIILPTFRGKQGNPMVWGRSHFAAIQAVNGDVGARHVAAGLADRVTEVEVADDAVLRDFDTADALNTLPEGMRPAR